MATEEAVKLLVEEMRRQNEEHNAAIQKLLQYIPQAATKGVPYASETSYSFSEFDNEKEDFKQYRVRFLNYLELRNIALDDKRGVSILIQVIGAKTYAVMTQLCAPREPKALTLLEVLNLLENYLCPQKSKRVLLHKFMKLKQNGNNISKYIAELRAAFSKCQLPDDDPKKITDLILSQFFIEGLQDDNMREKLLQEPEDTECSKLVEIASAIEASKVDNKQLSISVGETNQIHNKKPNNTTKHEGKKNKFSPKNSNKDADKTRPKLKIDTRH